MKPPICAICGSKEGCDTVLFSSTPEGEEFRKSRKIGHDPDMEWFCNTHLGPAKAFSHLTLAEALKVISGY